MTVQNRLVLDPDVCHMHTNGEKVNQDINRWVKSREIEGLMLNKKETLAHPFTAVQLTHLLKSVTLPVPERARLTSKC